MNTINILYRVLQLVTILRFGYKTIKMSTSYNIATLNVWSEKTSSAYLQMFKLYHCIRCDNDNSVLALIIIIIARHFLWRAQIAEGLRFQVHSLHLLVNFPKVCINLYTSNLFCMFFYRAWLAHNMKLRTTQIATGARASLFTLISLFYLHSNLSFIIHYVV